MLPVDGIFAEGTNGALLSLLGLFEQVFEGGKKAAQNAGRGNGALQGLALAKRNNFFRGVLQTETVSGALRAQQFHLRGAKVGDQPRNAGLVFWFIV
jgi:hypothetical protein